MESTHTDLPAGVGGGGNRDGLQATVDPHPTASAYPSDVPADNR
ncbi:hypothetical protein RCH21_000893 [Arthrobacter sp. PL16]|nr:hypothetical protein [Arthrobacter sp. PL16]